MGRTPVQDCRIKRWYGSPFFPETRFYIIVIFYMENNKASIEYVYNVCYNKGGRKCPIP